MSLWNTTCAIHRPFGDDTVAVGIEGRLVPDFVRGQMATGLRWTHYLDLPAGTDIRDGGTRGEGSSEITFADGDEVRVPSGSAARFVVVWVEQHNLGGPMSFCRAYLTRHDAGVGE